MDCFLTELNLHTYQQHGVMFFSEASYLSAVTVQQPECVQYGNTHAVCHPECFCGAA